MSKINVGTAVYLNNGAVEGEPLKGVVVAREIKSVDNNKCEVKYMVKPVGSEGFDSYQIVTRKDLVKIVTEEPKPLTVCKHYPLDGGFTLTLVAVVERHRSCWGGVFKVLNMGYSICSPLDKFDENFGFKAARHRAKKHPFCAMRSEHSAEFDENTTIAIMDAKAKYVKAHPERFIAARGDNQNEA